MLAVRRGDEDVVYVLPITHAAPLSPSDAVEIPPLTKARLGLDADRSWIVITEANVFTWPGPDLRVPDGTGVDGAVHGWLPPALLRRVRDGFAANVEARRAGLTKRSV